MRFHVPMEPVGKARARSAASGHHYTPTKTRIAEEAVAACYMASDERFDAPLKGPCRVRVVADFALPASCGAKRRERLAGTFCQKRPDADNILKLVADALNGIAFADDKQIVYAAVVKLWAEKSALGIEIEELA